MTTYFSHPQMNGLYGWEYMSISRNSALLDGDGKPKLNGLVWYYLNRIRYQTDTSKITDFDGVAHFRGFKGGYDLTITVAGETFPATITMGAGGIYQVVINYNGITAAVNTTVAVEDAHILKNNPTTNRGGAQRMTLRSHNVYEQIAFLKFAVSGLTGTPMKTRLRISSDTLVGSVEAYAVADNTWKESTITWENQPVIGVKISEAVAGDGETFDIDLGNYVTENGTLSIALKTTSTVAGKIHSSESLEVSLRPQLLIDLDSDSDGLHDGWEIFYAGGLEVMDGSSETDGDGSKDSSEYLAGTNPNDPQDFLKILTMLSLAEPDQWEITWASKLGKNYRVMTSATLQAGSWVPDTGTVISAVGETTSADLVLPNDPKVFYRVEVVNE